MGALGAEVARNYARKRSTAPTAPTPGVQKIELSPLQRVTLSHGSQSAWSLTRRHWQSSDAAIHLDVRSGKVANLPAFLRHFTEARPLSVVVSRRFQSRASRSVQLANKMAAPIVNGDRAVFSLYLYHVGGCNVDFKSSYTLDFIAALIRSPI